MSSDLMASNYRAIVAGLAAHILELTSVIVQLEEHVEDQDNNSVDLENEVSAIKNKLHELDNNCQALCREKAQDAETIKALRVAHTEQAKQIAAIETAGKLTDSVIRRIINFAFNSRPCLTESNTIPAHLKHENTIIQHLEKHYSEGMGSKIAGETYATQYLIQVNNMAVKEFLK